MPFKPHELRLVNLALAALSSARSVGRGWTRLILTLAALGLLACVLPGPLTTMAVFAGRRSAVVAGSGAAAVGESAMLLMVATLVWLLLIWGLAVAAAAGAASLPGTLGSVGRGLLTRIAPAVLRNVLLTAVGASMVAGLTGCATGSQPDPTSNGSAAGITVQYPNGGAVEGSALPFRSPGTFLAEADSSGNSTPTGGRLDIDWPAVPSAGSKPVQPGAPAAPGAPGRQNPGTPTGPTASQPASKVALDWPGSEPGSRSDQPIGSKPSRIVLDWPGISTSDQPSGREVVVLRGDSLWSIAGRNLPAAATAEDKDKAWRAWYLANAAVIGSDPNLILPGQILLPPTPTPISETDTES